MSWNTKSTWSLHQGKGDQYRGVFGDNKTIRKTRPTWSLQESRVGWGGLGCFCQKI